MKKVKNLKKRLEFRMYAYFVSLPKDEKKKAFGFYTDKDFCKKYGVGAKTLVDWKKTDELWDLRDENMKAFKDQTSEILEALKQNILARKGSKKSGIGKDVMVWCKLIENYQDKKQVDLGERTIDKLNEIQDATRKLFEEEKSNK